MNSQAQKYPQIALSFKEISSLNKFSKIVPEASYMNTLLDNTLVVVQSEVSGNNIDGRVTYAMVTVYSQTGIDYIVYKRITSECTQIRKIYIGE